MTVRGLLLALAVLASTPTEAASCHRYSRWYYPWPQRCYVAHAQIRPRVSREKAAIELPAAADIPMPFLSRADCLGGEADDETRARLMLRAALEIPDAH